MFRMFSTPPASTMTNLSKGFTGQKLKLPNVSAVPYGFTALTPQEPPKRVDPLILILILLLIPIIHRSEGGLGPGSSGI